MKGITVIAAVLLAMPLFVSTLLAQPIILLQDVVYLEDGPADMAKRTNWLGLFIKGSESRLHATQVKFVPQEGQI